MERRVPVCCWDCYRHRPHGTAITHLTILRRDTDTHNTHLCWFLLPTLSDQHGHTHCIYIIIMNISNMRELNNAKQQMFSEKRERKQQRRNTNFAFASTFFWFLWRLFYFIWNVCFHLLMRRSFDSVDRQHVYGLWVTIIIIGRYICAAGPTVCSIMPIDGQRLRLRRVNNCRCCKLHSITTNKLEDYLSSHIRPSAPHTHNTITTQI